MRTLCQLLILTLAPFVLGAEEFRTWNMIGGGYFEAKLNQVESTTLKLENREGLVIDFPLADLKPSDQQFAREWLASQNEATVDTNAAFRPNTEFAKRVYDKLVISKGSRLVDFEPEPSAKPKYFAFYRSALWCPPCRAFTPDLVDFYNKQKHKGAAFELIFISSDRSEDLMAEYMDSYDMEWPAFHYGKNKSIVQRNGNGIPSLIVTDAEGSKLFDSYDSSGQYIGPRTVMAQLEKLLEDAD